MIWNALASHRCDERVVLATLSIKQIEKRLLKNAAQEPASE